MNNFENQLQESAARMKASQMANLRPITNPRKRNSVYWGWIATPAAAVVGALLGIFLFGTPGQNVSQSTVVEVRDTIYQQIREQAAPEIVEVHDIVYRQLRDTVYLFAAVPDTLTPKEESAMASNKNDPCDGGCSIAYDGIDYSKLICLN